jgi:hypothetical protein
VHQAQKNRLVVEALKRFWSEATSFLQQIAVRPACAPNRMHQAQKNRLVV